MNWLGMWTLAGREVRRFLNVWSQTVIAPLLDALAWRRLDRGYRRKA